MCVSVASVFEARGFTLYRKMKRVCRVWIPVGWLPKTKVRADASSFKKTGFD